MKEEIIGGLRNALDRNETIEKAMQTFINAGYSAAEVREAAKMINPSATGMLYGEPNNLPASSSLSATQSQSSGQAGKSQAAFPKPQAQAANQTPVTLPVTNVANQAKQTKGRKTAIILAIVLIILVIVLGATIFFSDRILSIFSS